MTTQRQHWAEIGESTFAVGIWILYGIHRAFGRLPFRLCLYPVVFWYWLTRPLARRASLDYLRRLQQATGALGAEPGLRHSLRHFLAFAETLLDKTLAVAGRYRPERVRYEGSDMMASQLATGRGGIIVTAHMGCLELCRVLGRRRDGLRLTVLVHTAHAERFNRLLRRLDPDAGLRLLQVTEVNAATAMLLAERIAAGEFIAIAGDRVPVGYGRTVSVPFLGAPAPFPIGPYVLAALLKCPLFLMGCLREGRDHVVRFECLAETVTLPRARREPALSALAAAYALRLESLLRRAPYEWFNFYSFWEPVPDERPRLAAA